VLSSGFFYAVGLTVFYLSGCFPLHFDSFNYILTAYEWSFNRIPIFTLQYIYF
jgi:hypothetical protein